MFRHLKTEIISTELWRNVTLKLSLEERTFTFTWTVLGLGQQEPNSVSIQYYLLSKCSQYLNWVLYLKPLSLTLVKVWIHTMIKWKEFEVRQWEVQKSPFQIHPVISNTGAEHKNSKSLEKNCHHLSDAKNARATILLSLPPPGSKQIFCFQLR